MTNTEHLRTYIEELTLTLEGLGLPRTAARVLAWLLVCEPAEQTMNELMEALGLSKSSVSTATQSLIQFRLIERVSLPGKRRDYYRVQEDVWTRLIAARVEEIRKLRKVAERGLSLIKNTSNTRTERLSEMHDYAMFLEQEMPLLVERWQAWQLEQQAAKE